MAIDLVLLAQCEQEFGINCVDDGIKVVEVPDQTQMDEKFEHYDANHKTANLDTTIQNVSLLDLCYGQYADQERNPEGAASVTAAIGLDQFGGGGYMYPYRVIVYLESNTNHFTLRHEMGHAKQDIKMGLNTGNSNHIILDYHNILYNENPGHVNSPPRLCYLETNFQSPNPRLKSLTWDDFIKHATDQGNLQRNNNQTLITEIETILTSQDYTDSADMIKMNLVLEYFKDILHL